VRTLDSFARDIEWNRGVEEQLSNTLSVLKQVLARLRTSAIATASSHGAQCGTARSPCATSIRAKLRRNHWNEKPSIDNRNLGTHVVAASIGLDQSRKTAPFNNHVSLVAALNVIKEHITLPEGRTKDHAAEKSDKEVPEATLLSKEMQWVYWGEDPNFQAL
jgi:hypothetical protein